MPELPEVETTKSSLEPLIGKRVTAVTIQQASLRWPVPSDLNCLVGQRLVSLQRRAKYIIAHFEHHSMLWHLGMSGSLRISTKDDTPRKHDHVFFDFENQQLRYHDPRRFGCLVWLNSISEQKLLGHLAPEPLSPEFDVDYLANKLSKTATAIKICLMDQRIVVGVGNIYATEVLFKCGIRPMRPANLLSRKKIAQLVMEIRCILQAAIALGGSSLKDYVNAQGENGYFQQTLLTYGRAEKPCMICAKPLQQVTLGGRSSVYCSQCQK